MPYRTLVCRLCKEATVQTTPEVPNECPHCHGAAHWRVVEIWEVSEMDRRFLKSIRIAAD